MKNTIENISSSSNTVYFCPYCPKTFHIKQGCKSHVRRMHEDQYNFNVPGRFEKRIKRLEEKADELMPGDYTIEANFFRDDEGKDVHLVAVHNYKANEQKIEVRLHEYEDELKVEWK